MPMAHITRLKYKKQ